eukprot:TRINITY_DN16821_c0_g1_i1.p1 TRINITY_DN16821_c0_g1~~TRINITY_DN16821_c0_g1_i1.p1  ORF type:complete len:958 (-),score=174.47 TRINITY_DN16821_c0_g1_i1:780-3653(-)
MALSVSSQLCALKTSFLPDNLHQGTSAGRLQSSVSEIIGPKLNATSDSRLGTPNRSRFPKAIAFESNVGRSRGSVAVSATTTAFEKLTTDSVEDVATSTTKPDGSLPRGASWSVHKFGGTCVGTPERIQNVARIVASDDSQRRLVVVSAMSKVTDMMYRLLELAQARDEEYLAALQAVFAKHVDAATIVMGPGKDLDVFLRTLHGDVEDLRDMLRAIYIAGNATDTFSDFVVGHGELWSAQILAAAVRKESGGPCAFLDARDVLVVSPSSPTQVDPDYEVSGQKLEQWYERTSADCIVATGFIARTPDGAPTTLKRDGSDFSAAIFGSLLRAGRVTIWTDVNGVYSADPRKVPEAIVLEKLSYQEAWEMSYFGANVLHPRTTLPVMRYGIPLIIRNAFNLSAPGTQIGCSPVIELPPAAPQLDLLPDVTAPMGADMVVKGFATIDDIALINVEGTGMAGVPGTASEIFDAVKAVGANVVAISQASSEHSVCFAVPENEADMVATALEAKFRRALDAGRISKVEVVHSCSVLAAVGQRMASTPGVSATLFGALAKANINVRAIAQGCSEYNITVIVNQEDSIRALKAVHSRFYLSKTPLAVALIGPGLIGATLLEQLKDQVQTLRDEMNIDLRVLGIASSKKMLLHDTGVDLSNWQQQLETEGEATEMDKFTHHMCCNHFLPNTVLVDCTASADVAAHYYEWIRKGIHIVTPNKKANSGPLDQYLRLRALQRASYTHYFYEATVGAGLPIVSTLRGLQETGDRIQSIEGIFSGTLSYIFNTFVDDRAFSDVVREAKESGFTEPDPRDDLSGMDVARKVIILAREMGLPLELSDIPVESLVPAALQSLSSADEFMARLPEFDAELASRRREAESAGEVLRYVGVVDVAAGAGRVELRRYPKSHAFAQLSGSDNIIAFTTQRYKTNQPLVVRGPGAGAEVTAGGVFSDMLRLASYLGAPS